MAESTLTIAYSELQAVIGRFLGLGDPAGYGSIGTYGTKAYTIEQCIKAGVRKLLFPPPIGPNAPAHSWSFLKPTTTLSLEAPYSTGTIALTNGDATVTLTGGTLPTWIASGVLIYENRAYSILSRTNGTVFELDTAWAGSTVTGVSYSITQQDYDLPEAFHYILGDFTYEPSTTHTGTIPVVGEGQIMALRSSGSGNYGRPTMAAIRPKRLDPTVGQRSEVMFYPAPYAACVLSYKFAALPDKMSATDVYAWGGMAHSETLKEACLAAAEELENDVPGLHGQAFVRQLAASIAVDQRTGPHYLGYNADNSDNRGTVHRRNRGIALHIYTDANGNRYPS